MSHEMPSASRGRVRGLILLMLFVVTAVNYADRATISIAGTAIAKDLGLGPVQMGYIFSAFGWSYVAAQLPGGWLLDRFGSKWVYACSIGLWSLFTLLQGWVGLLGGAAVVALFVLRMLVGLAEAPSFPANSRIVAAWFPTQERGRAAAVFNSAQYFATVLFAPLMAWIVHSWGWEHVFVVMGGLGIALALLWIKVIDPPRKHFAIKAPELAYLVEGGALVDMDDRVDPKAASAAPPGWADIKQLLGTRMLLGVYLAQFCITAITYFFLTWFPIYLVKERGLSIMQAGWATTLPALCGFFGGILGGLLSDLILRRTGSLTRARKIPIVLGMLLSMVIVACNYVSSPSLVIGFMALAFFGKGVGSLGWAVVADTSPKEISGLSASLFNTFGNVAGITTPIIIGYIIAATGSFNGALAFVGLNAVVALASYLFIVGDIRRVSRTAR